MGEQNCLRFPNPFAFLFGSSVVKTGDKIPAAPLFENKFGDPDAKLNMVEYTANRKVAVVGLPGAFTPTWSNVQIPGYLESQDALKEAGIEEIIVYCVNDTAVMIAWAADLKIEGSMITFMADPFCEFSRACGMKLTHAGVRSLGLVDRCKRFAMIVDNNVITDVAIAESETDPAGGDFPEKTLAPALIEMAKWAK